MKKILAFLLALTMLVCLAACGAKTEEPAPAEEAPAAEAPAQEEAPAAEPAPTEEAPAEEADDGVMSYAEYIAADLDSAVVVDTYVQAHQSWWDNTVTAYTQDEDGAYFIYGMACSEEDAAKLVPGTKIRVSGYKSEWSGEVEIVDATFEFLDGSFIAEPLDITPLLGTDELIAHQNEMVSFKDMTVAPSYDADGNEVAYLYSWDGSGSRDANSDLYFNVAMGDNVYQFTVESYLCGNDTDVYAAVEALQVGDLIDMEGFLYWYEGVNPHITSVAPAAGPVKGEGVMTYAEYAAAGVDAPVVIETYVQAHQSWWDNTITVYTQDEEGGYFLYGLACTEEEAELLVPGTKIRVTGYVGEWSGEYELVDGTFEIIDGYYVAPSLDVTALLGSNDLINYQNRKVCFKGMTVEANGDGAFLYSWDGSGSHESNSDLYFNVSVGGKTYGFTVESYLCGNDTDVYAAVEALQVGDVIDMEGFLYWYEGVNPHITAVAPAAVG